MSFCGNQNSAMHPRLKDLPFKSIFLTHKRLLENQLILEDWPQWGRAERPEEVVPVKSVHRPQPKVDQRSLDRRAPNSERGAQSWLSAHLEETGQRNPVFEPNSGLRSWSEPNSGLSNNHNLEEEGKEWAALTNSSLAWKSPQVKTG